MTDPAAADGTADRAADEPVDQSADEPADEPADELGDFVTYCVPLTGFAAFDLYATGMARLYLDTARGQVGAAQFAAFWTKWKEAVAQGKGPQALDLPHREVARALIYLWYTGAWPRLAPAAHATLRREVANTESVASPSAYVEGLVWRTFHGHPAGAKPPGFGTWAVKPPAPVRQGLDRLGTGLDLADVPYRTGLADEVAPDAIPDELIPGHRLSRHIPPSAVPTAAAAGREAAATPEEATS
ncbi:hypothetical protein ACGFOU_23375 [Streptomyces sp. NPDC048595]|uniref:hypothetical protein n=1 Tax=Streptomyces sp. NPDC048595 TaxID=3365576 RepID=UPI0037181759